MSLLALGKFSAGGRAAAMAVKSMTSTSLLGALSPFSTAHPLVANARKPSPSRLAGDRFGLPVSPVLDKQRVAENLLLRMAVQGLEKRQNAKINHLQGMLDLLRIARLPADAPATVAPTPTQQQQVFQAMNRNNRKPKRANHGKRPCSRCKRRYQKKKWQNTSRRG